MDVHELKLRIKKYYDKNPSGGALHIVLDDGNVEASHILWCLENTIAEEKDSEARKIATGLLELSKDQRDDLYDEDWGMSR